MKGLASVLGIILLSGCAALAGSLELSIGGGPSAISLDAFNGIIESWNALIGHFNEFAAAHPDVSGSIPTLDLLTTSLVAHAAERYWILDWFALGARFEYEQSKATTSGTYVGAETSRVDIDLEYQTIGLLAGTRILFLDAGLRLAGDVNVGYYHGSLNHSVVFQVPTEYTDAISGLPPEGSGRHSGNTVGFEVGLALDIPFAAGGYLGAAVAYRSAMIDSLTNTAGEELDLDGDGTAEDANLSAISVRFCFSIDIDLSLDGEKE
ncbi:MAG: hypothetical protein NTY63_05965 [Candidatus Bipolaricaulota bacterium]|nr:hypothetical protein [Candidatus Bipolaricaulota bacterium]